MDKLEILLTKIKFYITKNPEQSLKLIEDNEATLINNSTCSELDLLKDKFNCYFNLENYKEAARILLGINETYSDIPSDVSLLFTTLLNKCEQDNITEINTKFIKEYLDSLDKDYPSHVFYNGSKLLRRFIAKEDVSEEIKTFVNDNAEILEMNPKLLNELKYCYEENNQ